MSKIQFSFILKNRIFFIMIFGILFIFGLIFSSSLPIAFLPNIELPKLTVITNYENASVVDVENLVTKPILHILNTTHNLDKIETETMDSVSIIKMSFRFETDLAHTVLEIREKLDMIRDILPKETNKPVIAKLNPDLKPFFQILFTSHITSDEKNLKSYVNSQVLHLFDRIEGVASTEILGGYDREIKITLDPKKLDFYHIPIGEIKQKIINQNKNIPAGQLPYENKDLLIRSKSEFETIDDIKNIILHSGTKLDHFRLQDLAEIKEGYQRKNSYTSFNGKESVIVNIIREPGKNSVALADEIKNTIYKHTDIFQNFANCQIVYDESEFIMQTIKSLVLSLCIGAISAFFCLYWILRNPISPILLLTTIPITIFISVFFFNLFGITFNMMSMGGLAIGIGMLYDSGNVVLSGIERILAESIELEKAILIGLSEVFQSVTAATLTTVIVFVPIVFLENIVGILFSEMALTIVITIIVSYFCSIFLLPILVLYFYPYRNKNSYNNENRIIEKLRGKFLSSLDKVFDHKRKLLYFLFFMILFGISFLLQLKFDFLPKIPSNSYRVSIQFPHGTKFNRMLSVSQQMENQLIADKNISNILMHVGSEENQNIFTLNSKKDQFKSTIEFSLNENSDFDPIKINSILSKFQNDEEIQVWYEDKIGIFDSFASPNSNRLEFKIYGENLLTLAEIGEVLKQKIANNTYIRTLHLGMEAQTKELVLKSKKERLLLFGISEEELASFLTLGFIGDFVTETYNKNKIRMYLKNDDLHDIGSLINLNLITKFGTNIALHNLVDIEEDKQSTVILREGLFLYNYLQIHLKDGFENKKEEIYDLAKNFVLPNGVRLFVSQDSDFIKTALIPLFYSFLLSILMIYMLLSGLYESFRLSFLLVLIAPIVLILVFPFSYIFNSNFNVSSFIGLILLLGVVVDNSALFYEYFSIGLKSNLLKIPAAKFASNEIFKTMIMNNSTSILGMLPIAVGLGFGNEFQYPLSIVIVFGLIISTFVSLYLLPVVFSTFYKENM
ncbi:efflux RND transporter permease subunit [Leptospira sp. 96542]|nr:efflux RND transporter permease subunit [Leptospira sp. 96542]